MKSKKRLHKIKTSLKNLNLKTNLNRNLLYNKSNLYKGKEKRKDKRRVFK